MPIIKHIVNVWEQKKFDDRPWTSLCAGCGNEGQFVSIGEAKAYANLHVGRKGGEVVESAPAKPSPPPKTATKPVLNAPVAAGPLPAPSAQPSDAYAKHQEALKNAAQPATPKAGE
jgi:hypothetical protein